MEKKKIIIISIIAFLGILLIGGVTYSWFNYTGVSNVNNTVIAGDIRMNVTEGSDILTLPNVFPETKEEAREREDNTLTFTVSGTNETGKAILYNILLSEGTTKSGKTRFRDNEIMFDLVEIVNNNEVYLVEAESYETLNNTNIYDNIIPASTTNVSHTYKLRAWINENVIISETEEGDHVYHPSDYKDLYATIKIGVRGNTVSGESYTVTFDANGGTVGVSTKNVIVGQNYGYLPTPTKEGYTFLGWNGKNLLNLNINRSNPSSVVMSNTTERTFEPNTYVVGLAFNNYYSPIAVLNHDISNNSVKLSARSGYGVGFPLLSSSNKTYTLSFDTDSTAYRGYSFLFYTSAGALISYSNYSVTNNHVTRTFTTPNSTYYLVIVFYGSDANTNITLSNIQLEEGNTATEWEPYFVTNDVKVIQEKNHTLKAIWQANS